MHTISNPEECLESFRRGEEKAFAAIFEFFYPKLVIASFRIIKDEPEAQDIASKVLEKLPGRSHIYATMDHLTQFLYLATRNASINYLRHIRYFNNIHTAYVATQLDEVDLINHQLDAALLDKLYQSIDRLPARSKQVINYLYVQRLPYQKIADLMNTTIKNIENIRSYALNKLRADVNISKISSTSGHALLLAVITYFLRGK